MVSAHTFLLLSHDNSTSLLLYSHIIVDSSCTAGHHFLRCNLRRSLQNSSITKRCLFLYIHIIDSFCSSCTAGHHFQRCSLRRSLQNSSITKRCFVIQIFPLRCNAYAVYSRRRTPHRRNSLSSRRGKCNAMKSPGGNLHRRDGARR